MFLSTTLFPHGTRWLSPALFVALLLGLALTGCEGVGIEWDGMEAPCKSGAPCDRPSLPDAANAWNGEWTGAAEVTYYNADGGVDSTAQREVTLDIEFNPHHVESIQFGQERRPSRYVGETWEHLSADSLRVTATGDTMETAFVFRADDSGAEGRVAVQDSEAPNPLRQVWTIDMHRPKR